jgi:hypothetical protein
VTDREIADAITFIETVRAVAVDDQDWRAVDHGVSMLASGSALHGYLSHDLNTIVRVAIEAGYGQALADVRAGRVDGLGPAADQ